MPKTNKTSRSLSVASRTLGILRLVLFSVALTGVFLYTRVSTPTHVQAAVPGTLNFQARLLTGAGSIVPDGVYNAEFKLYNALTSSGSSQGSCTGDAACLWTETRLTTDAAALRVNVRSGYLSVSLGDKTAFTGVNWDQQLYLTMNIGGTSGTPSWDGEMTPRLKLTSVPYAQQAAKANQLAQSAGANTGTLSFGGLTNNPAIQLPDIAGTNNVLLQSGTTLFTQGSVPFTDANGRLQQDNASLFFDDANNTLGVGTTRTGAISGTNARLVVKGSGTTSASSSLNVTDSSNTSLLFVRDDGNVGIGDNSPLAALTVGSGDLFQVSSGGAILAATGVTSSGTITFSALNCTTFTNGGALTTNASGVISCSNDDGGAGGGSVSSAGGTTNRIAKFTAAQNIEDSSISDDGTTVTVLGSTNLLVQGGTNTIGTTGTLGKVVLHDGNGQTTTLNAGNSTANLSFFLPTADGGNTDCLKTNGSGQLLFANCNNGSGSGGAVTLQDAYNSSGTPASIALATGKDLNISSPDVATDPNIIFNLQCTTCSASGGRFVVQTGGTDVLTVSPNGGDILIRTATNSATGFRIQSASGAQTVLSANTVVRTGGLSGNLVKIGDSTGTDADTTILQVDSASANPTTNLGSLNGGIFYNSGTGKLNIIEGGAVKTVCNTTDLNCATGSGVTTIGTINSQTKSGDGAVINGTTLVMQTADATSVGLVSVAAQDFAGAKTFSSIITASATGTTALAVTGAPTNSATSSLFRLGAAIAGGNSAANGGTYIGLNAPSSGAGSAADFLNFQTNGTYKLKVTSTGLVDSASGFAVAGSAGGSVTCSGGQVLSDSVVSGGILTTTGSCITPSGTGASTSLNNLTATSINQSLVANANNSLDVGASGTTYRSGYFGTSLTSPSLDSAASTSLSVGGTNATAVSIGRTGVTTTIAGSTSLGNVTAGTWNGTAIGIGYGGTGATTAQGAINAISGLTTNGDLMYHNGTNTTRLPRGANGQCLTSNTTTIAWGSCGAGGGGSLQGAYDTSSTTDPQILLSSTNGGIKIRDGTTAVTGNLLQLQNNAGTATYLGISATTFTLQDSSGNNALIFDSVNSELKIYGNTTNPTSHLRLYYDAAAGEAVLAASAGATRVGNGSGDVTISLTAAADTVIHDHTFSAAASYSGTDFYVSRNITGSSHAITGSVMSIEDLTTFSTGSSAPNVLYVNQNNTSATGNLILAQAGGGANDKFKVTTAGTVIIAAGQSYTAAGAVTVSSAASTALTLTSNAAATWSTSSGNLTIQAGGANTVILKPGTDSANALQVQNAAGTSMLAFDSSANQIKVGISDTVGTLLVLDTKTDIGDPTGVNGAMYYNSNAGKFRCYEAAAWKDCISAPTSKLIVKGAAESVNNSAVLQDDNDLLFTMGPNEVWVFHYVLLVSNNNSAGPDWKSAILASGIVSCNVTLAGSEPAGAAFPQVSSTDCATPANLANTVIAADVDAFNVTIQGRVTAGASGGTVKLQWAQNTATAVNLDVRGGSYVIAQKVGGN